VWGKSIEDGERWGRWDSWTMTTTAKGVELVFRVSGTTILGKETVQGWVVEQTRRRKGVRRLNWLFLCLFTHLISWFFIALVVLLWY